MAEFPKTATGAVLEAIMVERWKQDDTWGEQNHGPFTWLGILMEEVGEASAAALEGDGQQFRKELIQAAAVTVAIIESLGRGDNSDMVSLTKLQKEIASLRKKVAEMSAGRP